MLSTSPKLLKSLMAVLCLSMISWSAVSAQSLVLCLSENGHAEIESVLDSCCLGQEFTQNEITMQASDACGNCTDIPLSFYFHQSSSGQDLEIPATTNLAALASYDIDFKHQNFQDHSTPDIVLHAHLERILILQV